MFLVTGATGTIGRELVRALPESVPLRLMTRDPARLTAPREGAETVTGDYADPDSLDRALRGVRAAFLVTNRPSGEDDAAFLRAALRAGVGRVVKLSAAAVTDPDADDLITRVQRDNERQLRESGIAWTLLRPRAFMSNRLAWAASIRAEGVVRAGFGDAPNAMVDPRDIAAVAALALTEDRHEGRAYSLTGPEALSAVQQTVQLAEVLGVPLRFEELGPEAARAELLRRYPAPIAEALLSSALRQAEGAKARVEGTVGEVTGRPARSFRTWAEDHARAFVPVAAGAATGA